MNLRDSALYRDIKKDITDVLKDMKTIDSASLIVLLQGCYEYGIEYEIGADNELVYFPELERSIEIVR